MTITICSPATFPLRRVTHCPTCDTRRRFAGYASAWYGTLWTCCGCGDSWGDGERQERPFQRAWRVKAVAEAKELWAEAGRYTRADYDRWIADELRSQLAVYAGDPTP